MPESPYPMLPVEEALSLVLQNVSALPPETASFDEALGLVLAEDIIAADSLPPFPASTVDGYAVPAADSGPRRIVGNQMAGYMADIALAPGQAARVTTGAPIPPGADAVVMVEDTIEADGLLRLTTALKTGDNIRPVGFDVEAGRRVLTAGTTLNPAEIGLLATVGQTTVRVYPRPAVAVMSTGDEVVAPDRPLQPGQIRDANRFALLGAVRQAGGLPLNMGIIADQTAGLAQTINRALAAADVIITSGGVSMGQLDLVKPYLAEHGALLFGRVRAKPGKPVTFGLLQGKPFFALPGNPVSALVSFENFVRPALRKMAGQTQLFRPRRSVILQNDVRHTPDRTEFQRAVITRQSDGSLTASTTGGQQSSRLLSLQGANGLIILPHGHGNFSAGSRVQAIILDDVG